MLPKGNKNSATESQDEMLNYCPIEYTFTNSAYTDLNTTDQSYSEFEIREIPGHNNLQNKEDIALYEDLSGKHAPKGKSAKKKENVCNILRIEADNKLYEDLSGRQETNNCNILQKKADDSILYEDLSGKHAPKEKADNVNIYEDLNIKISKKTK